MCRCLYPASILYKSIAGRYRPVRYPDGPITARYRFIKNAYWAVTVCSSSSFGALESLCFLSCFIHIFVSRIVICRRTGTNGRIVVAHSTEIGLIQAWLPFNQ